MPERLTLGHRAQPARCGRCGHVWTVAYLPMDAGTCARIFRSARCPKCGNGPRDVYLQDTEPEPEGDV